MPRVMSSWWLPLLGFIYDYHLHSGKLNFLTFTLPVSLYNFDLFTIYHSPFTACTQYSNLSPVSLYLSPHPTPPSLFLVSLSQTSTYCPFKSILNPSIVNTFVFLHSFAFFSSFPFIYSLICSLSYAAFWIIAYPDLGDIRHFLIFNWEMVFISYLIKKGSQMSFQTFEKQEWNSGWNALSLSSI